MVGAATAQNYPTRPITVIMPFAGGSGSDVAARIVYARMAKTLGQPIIVENKPGAGGNSGTLQAAKAMPDGYTLVGAGSGPFAANLTLYKELGYDPQKDFTLISPFVSFTVVITASNKLGLNSVQDLIARARKEPGALNYGSVGIGSSQHLAGEYFAQVTGVKITHVPYRNIAQFGPDLIAGAVPLGFAWYPNVAGPLNANGATALAVAGEKRLAVLPGTPTTTEVDLAQYQVDGWFGLAAPAGVPKDIIERLNKELNAALNDPEVRGNFEKVGAVPFGLGLDESKTFLASEIAKYRDIITKAGIAKIE
ncbi:MAG: tripartite tricarboxylate transporter substrate binding protein [Alphaproteobacteria bacterium]|nr:MAG: tripartite tricarboxylate transporter substrate binding protein [Alphaproteobacteria bacterium]